MGKSIGATIIALFILSAAAYWATMRQDPTEACAETLMRVKARAAIRWSPTGTSDGGPSRADTAKQVTEPGEFRTNLFKGVPGCPAGGNYTVGVLESGGLNVPSTYTVRCSIHGDIESVRQKMGVAAFDAYLKNMATRVKASRQPEGAAMEL